MREFCSFSQVREKGMESASAIGKGLRAETVQKQNGRVYSERARFLIPQYCSGYAAMLAPGFRTTFVQDSRLLLKMS